MVEMRFPETNGYVLERRVFEKYLAAQAAGSGALIKTKADAFEFERKDGKVNVKVREGSEVVEYSAKLIFACDGVETLTARRLGVNTTMPLADSTWLSLDFSKRRAPGKCWNWNRRNKRKDRQVLFGQVY
jgi:flavin-dependent dehydrogenase